MRRVLAFGILAGPALAWVPVSMWCRAHVEGWVASGTELPLPIRIGLAIDNHLVRLFPFAVIATVLAMPFLAWIASFLASAGFESNLRALLGWTVFGNLVTLPLLILVLLHSRHWVSAFAPLMWAGIVTYESLSERDSRCSGSGTRQARPRGDPAQSYGWVLLAGLAASIRSCCGITPAGTSVEQAPHSNERGPALGRTLNRRG